MSSGSDVPSDVWWRIMTHCGPNEIVSLGKCCKMFHSITKSRTIWLRCLQSLGPYEAPGIPPHVLPESLSSLDLRHIATSSQQRITKWESDSPLRLVQETIISLKDVNPDEVLGEPMVFGMQLFLLPGGSHLLIFWPAGYLQCWSVPDGNCVWVYPDLPEGASEDRPKLLNDFAFEMQENGDVNLLLIDEFIQDPQMGDRYPKIVRFTPGSQVLEIIQSGKQLNRAYGMPNIVKLQGNISVIYQEHIGVFYAVLTVFFQKEEISLTITELKIECLEIVDDLLVCVCTLQTGDKSLVVVPLSRIMSIALNETQRTVPLTDVISAAMLLEPKSFSLHKAKLSINTTHWKAKGNRDKIYITVLYKDSVSQGNPYARFVLHKDDTPPDGSNTFCIKPISLEDDDDWEDSPNASLKLGNVSFDSYSTLTAPTLFGQSLALLHSSNTPSLNENTLALASISRDGVMKFKALDLGADYPAFQTLCTELYGGAIIYATEDYQSVVIKYFE